jgi:hypothetical protein
MLFLPWDRYVAEMDWSSLVSTVAGGVLVLASTWFSDVRRWRRAHLDEAEDRRRQAYAAYLAVVADAGNSLRLISRNENINAGEAAQQAHDGFASSGVHARRFEVDILAPEAIAD